MIDIAEEEYGVDIKKKYFESNKDKKKNGKLDGRC
jgi:hypothetical protein